MGGKCSAFSFSCRPSSCHIVCEAYVHAICSGVFVSRITQAAAHSRESSPERNKRARSRAPLPLAARFPRPWQSGSPESRCSFARHVLAFLGELEDFDRVPVATPQFGDAKRCVNLSLIEQLAGHFHFNRQVGRRIGLETDLLLIPHFRLVLDVIAIIRLEALLKCRFAYRHLSATTNRDFVREAPNADHSCQKTVNPFVQRRRRHDFQFSPVVRHANVVVSIHLAEPAIELPRNFVEYGGPASIQNEFSVLPCGRALGATSKTLDMAIVSKNRDWDF